MSDSPLVTIAIPTYNRAGTYLSECLVSASVQTYRNLEIIVSDNCSSDQTPAYVAGFKDARIRYFRHERNIGANNNFNFCLSKATGEYFLLLQDDDMIDPDFIETCIKEVGGGKEFGIIRTGTRIIDGTGRVFSEMHNLVGGLPTEEFFLGWFTGKTSHYLCSTLFNTSRLREIGGFGSKHNLFQDVLAEVVLAAKYGRADVAPSKASFRKHKGEMTFAVAVSAWCEDSLLLLSKICDLSMARRDEIRRQGMRFFSKLNYSRAMAVRSPMNRLKAYMTVYRKFGYRHLPPVRHLVGPLYPSLHGGHIHQVLRSIKRQLNGSFRRNNI